MFTFQSKPPIYFYSFLISAINKVKLWFDLVVESVYQGGLRFKGKIKQRLKIDDELRL
jgi:hypothetical protein